MPKIPPFTQFQEATPPTDPGAEQAVLGALILRPAMIDVVHEILSPEDFYRESHRQVYKAIVDLWSAREPVDYVTVSTYLRDRKRLEEVGGDMFIVNLGEQVGIAANADYYARLVRDKAILRRLLACSQDIATACLARVENLPEFLSWAEAEIFEHTRTAKVQKGPRAVREMVDETVLKIEQVWSRKAELTGLPSGFVDLDYMTGGFQDTDLIIIAGRPGMGKSGLGLLLCSNLSDKEIPSLYFSMEMGDEQTMRRLLASRGNLNTVRLRDGKLSTDDWVSLQEAAGNLLDSAMYLDESSSLTALEIYSRTRRLVSQEGIRFVVVDYLQRVRAARARSQAEEIGENCKIFKNMAKDLKIPVVVLSQLNRDCENREDKRPLIPDLKGSGDIDQEADVIIFLYRDDYYHRDSEQKGVAELIFRKHRNGPCGTVELQFDAASVNFRDLAREHNEPWQNRY